MTPVHTITLPIINALGLHARAAAKFCKLANEFDAEVTVTCADTDNPQTVSGKSIMGLLMLVAVQGVHIRIDAVGTDAEDVLEALSVLVKAGFYESSST